MNRRSLQKIKFIFAGFLFYNILARRYNTIFAINIREMIAETFGLTTANFAKFIILVVFLFFFIRTVNLMISFIINKKNKSDLRKLFVATEILLWSTLVIWVYFMVPIGKLKFLAVFALLNVLNFWLWLKIKNGIAGLFFRIAYPLKKGDVFMIGSQIFTIGELKYDSFETINDESTKQFYYIDALTKGIKLPFKDSFKVTKINGNKIQTKEDFLEVLEKNGFITNNIQIEIILINEDFIVHLHSFEKNNITEIIDFIKEIF